MVRTWYFARTTQTTCIDINLATNMISYAFRVDDTYIAFGSFNKNAAAGSSTGATSIKMSSSL